MGSSEDDEHSSVGPIQQLRKKSTSQRAAADSIPRSCARSRDGCAAIRWSL
jgi:hypothetical protein